MTQPLGRSRSRYLLAEPPPDEYAPVIDFDTFMTYVFAWKQNQHIGVIGPTEQGKTNLVYHLLALRAYVAYLGIKSRDSTLEAFARLGGYTRLYDYPPVRRKLLGRDEVIGWPDMPRRLIWPDASDRREARLNQIRVFNDALDEIWGAGSICVVWDDFWYLINILGMEKDAKQNLLNARSADSAQVICAQRGAGNRMVELLDQPTWLFFAKETDPRNLALIGRPSSLEYGFVSHLDQFQFLAKNTRTGVMYRTTAPLLETA